MISILFVDDEPNVLSGIRRMLRSMRNEWQMQFVTSGQEALDELAREPRDVIVCDMRMPGMDGSQLLSEVSSRYPATIRVALSGETDQSMIYRCVQHAHQYLAKPCEPAVLIDTINRATRLRGILADEKLITRVSEMSTVPSLPEQYRQIMDELQSDEPSMRRIAEIIESDAGMTAKILQLVNSAFFGLSTHISSPAQAAMLLGIDVIRSLVVTSGVFTQLDEGRQRCYNLQAIWGRSTRVGTLARRIAVQESRDKLLGDYALMGGMLIDIGQLVFAANMSDDDAALLSRALQEHATDWQAELQIFGHTHMQVGAYLVGLWGLPNPIIETVAWHQTPGDALHTEFSALTAVHAALAIITEADGNSATLDEEYLSKLGVARRLDSWRAIHADLATAG